MFALLLVWGEEGDEGEEDELERCRAICLERDEILVDWAASVGEVACENDRARFDRLWVWLERGTEDLVMLGVLATARIDARIQWLWSDI